MKIPRRPQIKPDAPRLVELDPHMKALMIPHKVKIAGMNSRIMIMTTPAAAAPVGGGSFGEVASPYNLFFLSARFELQEAKPQIGHTKVLTMSVVSIY